MEDTRKELKRLEQELLKKDDEDILLDELIREVKGEKPAVESYLDEAMLREVVTEDAAPAFEDPDKILEPAEPMVYCNFSNDYGNDLPQEETELAAEEAARQDRLLITLMIIASALTLGIIGILIYWMVALLG